MNIKISTVILCALICAFYFLQNSHLLIFCLFFLSFCLLFINKPKFTLILFGIFLLFQEIIERYSLPYVRNLDELIIMSMFIGLFLSKLINRQKFLRTSIDFPVIVFITIGSISSLIAGLTSVFVCLSGILLMVKGFLVFYIFSNIIFKEDDVKVFIRIFFWVGIIIILGGIGELFFPSIFSKYLGIYPSYRQGMRTMQSFFGHPGGFAFYMFLMYSFSLALFIIKNKSRYIIVSFICLVGIVFTLRRTTIFSAGITPALLMGILVLLREKQVKIRKIVPYFGIISLISIIFSGIFIAIYKDLFLGYFFHSGATRNLMSQAGLRICFDYFPFGAGFGTFGSWMSVLSYSPLYYKYGLSNIWGLSPEYFKHITDIFWPSILAETGIFGFLTFCLILIKIFSLCFEGIKKLESQTLKIFTIGTCLLLISSIIESAKGTVYEISMFVYFYFGSVGIIYSLLKENNLKVNK